jgi:hypothetical protein
VKLLQDRRVSALLAAEVVSSIGTQMTWLALPWFVLTTTGSPQRMTYVIIAEVVPLAVFGFAGGAIADRLGNRRTMLVCDLARVPLMAAIPRCMRPDTSRFGRSSPSSPRPGRSSRPTTRCSARSCPT